MNKEMLGELLGYVLIGIVSFTIGWLLVSYIGWDLNISEWTPGIRVGHMVVVTSLLAGWIMYARKRR